MIRNIGSEVLASELEFVSLRRLNHGACDSLLVGLPDKKIFSFQVYQQTTLGEEHGVVQAREIEEEFQHTSPVRHPVFRESRSVKRVLANIEYERDVEVGFCITSRNFLPVFVVPGNILGSLCLFGLEHSGKENGLKFDPSMYRFSR